MALFDSIISGAAEKFGLGDKAGTLLSGLLSLVTNKETGGFGGFISRFKDAGLGDMVTSWIGGGDNTDISGEQIESALGSDAIGNIAKEAGLEKEKVTSALGFMLPQVVDSLTPDGEIPDDDGLLSKIGGFMTGIGGTAAGVVTGAAGLAGSIAGGTADKASDLAEGAADKVSDAAGATLDAGKAVAGKGKEIAGDAAGAVSDVAGAAADKVGDAAGATLDAGKAVAGKGAEVVGDAAGAVGDVAGAAADKVGDAAGATLDAGKAVVGKGAEVVGDAAGAVGDVAGAAADKVGDAFNSVGDVFDGDGDGGSPLKWIIPLLLVGLLVALGFMFCGKNKETVKTGGDSKTTDSGSTVSEKTVDSSVNLVAKDGKYTISGVVADQATKDKILAEAEKTWGKGNVDVEGLKIDANAKPFKEGWWDSFAKLLPDLKGWKDGTIGWAGDAIKTAGELPGAIGDKIKSLFGGWTIAGAADAVKNTVTDAARKLMDVTLSDDVKLQAYPGGIEDQLIKFIKSDEYKNATAEDLKDKWFDFDDLNFKFGTTTLVPESKRQLDNVVAILKAHPDVKIKIGGYTDKKGNDAANKKLSGTRANAVKAALAKAGVGTQVPEAEGYGEQFAKVAEDASDEERASDRKTSIRLLK